MKNRVNKLKKQYSSFKKLLSQSGFGWDNVNKTVTVEESSVWDSHIKDNVEWAKFKNDGFPQYPDLCIVFGDTYATGAYTAGNAEEYVVSDEEDNGVSGDNGGGDTTGDAEESNENDVDTGVPASDATPTSVHGKHKLNRTPNSKRRRKSNNHELGVTMKAIQEMIKSRTVKSTSDSITSEAPPPVAPPPVDPYSIAVVVAVLNGMSDLEQNLYNKAVNQACLNATWREAFMGQDFDDFDLDLDILMAWLATVAVDMSMHTREPIRDSSLSGAQWIREVLHGHSDRVYEAFRMEIHVFLNLCGLMKEKGWLEDTRYIGVDEQIGIFLSMICHKNSNRDLCERFQHSGQTISKYFTKVLQAVLKLAKEIIIPPSFDVVPQEILMDPKHKRYFKDCIGAIDGTHIHASVPVSKQISFRGRKSTTTQNVLCICSFDMKYTFVYAGWEGSANDCRVLAAALETPHLEFPRPPPGKYYVMDSGYAATPGFLTPFRGDRYHLNEYRGRARRPTTARELFNYRHSSLRNVIERSFAALKNRFFHFEAHALICTSKASTYRNCMLCHP